MHRHPLVPAPNLVSMPQLCVRVESLDNVDFKAKVVIFPSSDASKV